MTTLILNLVKPIRPRRLYLAGDSSAVRLFPSLAFSTENNDSTAQLQKTASEVCDIIRRQPRWESSLLSLLPSSTSPVFHPNCVSLVIRRLSDSNPLLSFRYLLWLSSTSYPYSLHLDAADSFLNALAASGAWRPALHAIHSIKCLNRSSLLDPFVLHLCNDTHYIYRDTSLLYDLCGILEIHCAKLSLRSWNSLLSVSLCTERTELFHRFYDLMIKSSPSPDASTAGYLIRALCRDNQPMEAYHVLRAVCRKGFKPDVISITQLISSFSKDGNFGRVSEILHLMISIGIQPDLITYQEIIHALCKGAGTTTANMVDEAFHVFRHLKLKGYGCDVVTYTTMIDGFCKSSRMEEALLLWSEMITKGVPPNNYTYNTIINGYFKTGDVVHAQKMYDEMVSKSFKESTVSCNTMMAGLCLNGRLDDAINLFAEMPKKGIEHDVITYNTLIKGLCEEGKMPDAMEIFSRMIAMNIRPSTSTYTPLIKALCKEGRMMDATELMKLMEVEGVEALVCTNDFIISGFCNVGDAENGMAWLSKMLQSNLKPKAGTMIGLVECLCSLGQVDNALQVVKNMFEFGYSFGYSVFHLLTNKLCGVNSYRIGQRMDEIMAI